MSERVEVNREHPDYPKYIEECEKLWAKYDLLMKEEESRVKAENPNWMNCRDAMETEKMRSLDMQRNRELRKLQEKYSYLFKRAD